MTTMRGFSLIYAVVACWKVVVLAMSISKCFPDYCSGIKKSLHTEGFFALSRYASIRNYVSFCSFNLDDGEILNGAGYA